MDADLERDLARWLVELHAVEQQALVHLHAAHRLVGEPAVATDLERHLAETQRHRAVVRGLLAERAGRPSRWRNAAATANRLGFLAYTAIAPDAPGKLLADSFAYEHLEIAAYRMLAHAADCAGDEHVRTLAREIADEEEAMAARLALRFDWAVDASARRRQKPGRARLVEHLRDAYALEAQAGALLTLAAGAVRVVALSEPMRAEQRRTRTHRARLLARLAELDSRPSWCKTAAMRAAGAAWAVAWTVQSYRPAKLVCFLYAERHLEIAAYELLAREAERAGDQATATLASCLLAEERAAAERLAGLLETAAEVSLRRRAL